MIAHFNIEQGTEEWHEIRHAKIGGTRASGLFKDTETLTIELLAELTEPFEMDYDSYESSDMVRGKMLESDARREASKYVGVEFHECGWLESEECSLLGISVDGITADFETTAEIKCPAKNKHMRTVLSDEIPLDNIRQSIHYFTVNPLCRKHYFVSYRPESIKPLFVKILTRASEVNIGTKAKPIIVTVEQAAELGLARGKEIAKDIESKLLILKNNF